MRNSNKTYKVVVMCLTDPSDNPRPKRVIELCCKQGYQVDVVSYKPKEKLSINNQFILPHYDNSFFNRKLRALSHLIIPFVFVDKLLYSFKEVADQLRDRKYDLLIVEDIYLLSLALNICKSGKIIFDAREFYPAQKQESIIWNLMRKPYVTYLCRKFASRVDEMITVSPGLINLYKNYFNVDASLVLSTPNYYKCNVVEVKSDRVRMVHHGAANENRALETMINMFEFLDSRFELDFYLVGCDSYINKLKRLAKNEPRIRFQKPVEYGDIIRVINQYDVGIFFSQPMTLNLKYALPNKLFEFIQARLMVAVGPAPDMADLVMHYRCGLVSKTFLPSDMASALNSLRSEDILFYKKRSNDASKVLCFQNEGKKLFAIFNRLLSQ
jgi:hypothetical protein